MENKDDFIEASNEVVDISIPGVPISRHHSGVGNVAGLTTGVIVILECRDFDVAVDAIERIERAWNGQLAKANYATETRAFVIKVEVLQQ